MPLYVAQPADLLEGLLRARPFDESTLDIPLGSGPYKVGKFRGDRYIEFERVKDWWGADLPVSRGSYNFDIVRYEFYRDRDVAFEGFTGRDYLFREEFTARVWATRYDFPARQGRPRQARDAARRTPSGAQGWFINTRRDKFKDPRVREALIIAFDFEWTNKTIMYGAYARTHSPFQNSDMMANGPPSPEELELLEPFRGQVPDEVFGDAVRAAGLGRLGAGPHAAAQGGAAAATTPAAPIKDGKRMTPNGEQFSDRVPARRAVVPAASRALHQEPRHARHRGEPAAGRSRAVPRRGSRISIST